MTNANYNRGAQFLRRWRTQNNLTQAEVCDELGLYCSTYSKYENGALKPCRVNAWAIQQYTKDYVNCGHWDLEPTGKR